MNDENIISFCQQGSEFEEKHRGLILYESANTGLEIGPRWPTFKIALNLIAQSTLSPRILETGCMRRVNDYAAGNSTLLFCDFLAGLELGGTLISVDNSEDSIYLASHVLEEQKYPKKVSYNFVKEHSVEYIMKLVTNTDMLPQDKLFDLVYLDSQDADPNDEAITLQSQIHQSEEVFYVLHLQPRMILLDDNKLPFGGKCRLSKERLWATNQYVLIYEDYQSLWLRK